MKVLGIDFVPLNTPLKHRLETLAAGVFIIFPVGLIPLGILITFYILFFTSLWPLAFLYLFWIWVIDKDASETGARRCEWLCSLSVFKYIRNYFPITFKTVPDFQLNPTQNYLCCLFPHGCGLPTGAFIALQTNACKGEVKTFIPYHELHGMGLRASFFMPLLRDFFLYLGICSATSKSLNWILNYPGGGKIAGLFVGGVDEAFLCYNGQYRLVLKNRKGFIKLALRNGSSIIPCFSFGQNSLVTGKFFRKGSILQQVQTFLERVTGHPWPLIYGRGLFQHNFGIIPYQKPINIVAGAPIKVQKVIDPSQEDIDTLHQVFVEKLVELFEKYKYEYEENPEESKIEIC